MKQCTFINVFRNRLIVDNIIKYLPYSPKNSYELPKTYFFHNSNLRELDYEEFYIYMVFYYGMEKVLYRYKRDIIIDILKKRNIIDVAAENNELKLIKKIYTFCNLSEYSDILERCFTTKRSLFSAIKHENIELIDFLNSNLNTVNTNYDEHLSLTSLLNFSMIQGKLKVVKFLCYNLLPFSQNINRCNLLKLELAIEEAVKYNNIECALFVLDYYVFQTKSMNYPKLSISLKDRIRTKANIINDHIFLEINDTNIIDWWYINYNLNKTNCITLQNYLEELKYNDNISDKDKAEFIITSISELLNVTDNEYNIYVILDNNNGYLTGKKTLLNNIINDLYYKPLHIKHKKNINLYKDYVKLFNLIK
tara:strand:+ start:1690 stop:2784 length:1095 start_codon:yes stop_codon:yes gene_type:complete